eukprot:1144540-Pelagomonas_calceolata.AAC.9
MAVASGTVVTMCLDELRGSLLVRPEHPVQSIPLWLRVYLCFLIILCKTFKVECSGCPLPCTSASRPRPALPLLACILKLAGCAPLLSPAFTTTHIVTHPILQNAEGAGLAPFDCWLALRGLRTMALRMERSAQNCAALANYLIGHPLVGHNVLNHTLPVTTVRCITLLGAIITVCHNTLNSSVCHAGAIGSRFQPAQLRATRADVCKKVHCSKVKKRCACVAAQPENVGRKTRCSWTSHCWLRVKTSLLRKAAGTALQAWEGAILKWALPFLSGLKDERVRC